MNNLLKIIVLTLLTISCNTLSAKDVSTLLLTGKSGQFTFDFLNADNVTSLQFDLSINGLKDESMEKMSAPTCVADLPKTHSGVCKIKGNRLRVIIYSQVNAVLNSGRIGTFNLGKKLNNLDIKISSVVMATPKLVQVQGEVAIDINNKPLRITDAINRK